MALSDKDAQRLNMSMPVANDVKLGDLLQGLESGEGNIPDGSITTAKFASDAKAPEATKADSADSVDWSNVQNPPTIPTAPATGTAAQLEAGTDTTPRLFSAKMIYDEIARQIAAIGS